MIFDQEKSKTQNPATNNAHSPLELKNLKAEVPEVDNLMKEIDQLLLETEPRSVCGC